MGRVMGLGEFASLCGIAKGSNPMKKRPLDRSLFMGRVMGFEPTNIGTTIRGLNHLATPAINLFNCHFNIGTIIPQGRVTTFGDTRHIP